MKATKVLRDDINPNGYAFIKSFNYGDLCWRVTFKNDNMHINNVYNVSIIIDVTPKISSEFWEEINFVFYSSLKKDRDELLKFHIDTLCKNYNNYKNKACALNVYYFEGLLEEIKAIIYGNLKGRLK